MIALLARAVPLVALLALGVLLLAFFVPVAPHQLSLAGDVGLTDQSVCDVLEAQGTRAIQRLNASGFPHPTSGHVELYRLLKDNATQAQIRIDWQAGEASCLPTSYDGPVDAALQMKPGAYDTLVKELRDVLQSGQVDLSAGAGASLLGGTHVEIYHADDGRAVRGDWWDEGVYKARLAAWAGGLVVTGGPA